MEMEISAALWPTWLGKDFTLCFFTIERQHTVYRFFDLRSDVLIKFDFWLLLLSVCKHLSHTWLLSWYLPSVPFTTSKLYLIFIYDQKKNLLSWIIPKLWVAGRHPACKNWVIRHWHGYLSGARCKWFAYSPLMPLPPIISCFVKILNGSAFLVLFYPGCPGKRQLNRCGNSSKWWIFIHDCGMSVKSDVHIHMCCRRCCCFPVKQLTRRSTLVRTEPCWVAIEKPSAS